MGDGIAPRTCRRCGCTDDDCGGCVARTGQPCTWVEADLCGACTNLKLPETVTPAIAEVLGMPNFRSGPVAHLFRAAGHEIQCRVEPEQAFVLWRFLHLAIIHGDDWGKYASADIDAHQAKIKAAKAGQVTS